MIVFFFKQKTAYEMRISDWSSDVCSSDLRTAQRMTRALEDNFANVVVVEDDDRRRRWRIQSPIPERLQPRQENTIEALEIAARAARDENRKIGRATWRERVCQYVSISGGAVSLKKKQSTVQDQTTK